MADIMTMREVAGAFKDLPAESFPFTMIHYDNRGRWFVNQRVSGPSVVVVMPDHAAYIEIVYDNGVRIFFTPEGERLLTPPKPSESGGV
jgi:hypothetical protein